uniref:Uncharacterized protein n=1 Tax=Strongyloides stercoralis TaxID=6248 RepID=A0AAF5D7E7_STRER
MIIFILKYLCYFYKLFCWILIIVIGSIITCLRSKAIKVNDSKTLDYTENDYSPPHNRKNIKLNNQKTDDEIYQKQQKMNSNKENNYGPSFVPSINDTNSSSELDLTQTILDSDSDEYSDKKRSNKESISDGERKPLKSCLKPLPNYNIVPKINKKVSFHKKIKIRVIESEETPSLRMMSESEKCRMKSESSAELNRLRMKKKYNPI